MKFSVPNIVLLGICMAVMASLIILNIFYSDKSGIYNSSITTLSSKDSGLLLLEKSKSELLLAEIEYRSFLSTRQPRDREAFTRHLDNFITNLNGISALSPGYITNLEEQLQEKLDMALLISNLKHSADSLLNSVDSQTFRPVNESIVLNRPISSQVLEKYFENTTDTVRIVPLRRKRGFFKRVGELFGGNKSADSTQVIHNSNSTQGMERDSVLTEPSEKIRALSANITNYYQKLINSEIELRKRIDEKEKQSAEKSISMLQSMEKEASRLLNSLQSIHESNIVNAAGNLRKSGSQSNRLFYISFVIIGVVTALLIYSIYRAVKYEKELLAAKAKADEMALLKSRFLSNMSHEIRTPLTAIIGFTEYLQSTGINKDSPEYLGVIKIASEHLLSTVNDILDHSRLEAGKIILREEPFLLKTVVDETISLYTPAAKKKKLRLIAQRNFDNDLAISGDAFRLKQVLYNLLNNAVKFTQEGFVTLTVSVQQLKDGNALLQCSVADSGIGIPKERMNYIFEEFAQVADYDKRIRRSLSGTGLGLAICKKLVELQGGSITAESELKKGSVFRFSIPCKLSHPSLVPQMQDEDMPHAAEVLKGKKILVAEDSDFNIMLISLLLTRYQVDFHVAKDGEHALNLYNLNSYDLVLTDIHIPKLSGYQLAYAIRKDEDPQKNSIPIIALTASPVSDDFAMYYQAGISDIMTKPFKEAELKSRLVHYLKNEGASNGHAG
ncbi:ATP-binding protein [Foetidibacter luteolus]|uniref:ATP-binding protein n=1 Tax=Foetidibacter luteolus TaxID=2608880 RepID=UPI00129ABDD4|nr:ATP-binding protein [Foetidibacter luteolus]